MKRLFKNIEPIKIGVTPPSAILLISCVIIFVQFLKFNEFRSINFGFEFADPFYLIVPSFDVSLPIFIVTYGSLLLYLIIYRSDKEIYAKIMVTYSFLILFRMTSLYILPLSAPHDLIFLEDPILNTFIYPGKIVTDLFFSGHCALLFALYFSSGRKWYFLMLALLLGILLMVQRCHYSIDILGAVPFAYFAWRLSDHYIEKWPFRR